MTGTTGDEHDRTAELLTRADLEQQLVDALTRLGPGYAPIDAARDRARERLRAAMSATPRLTVVAC